MDWTNTRHEAAGVDLQSALNQFIDQNPKTSQLAAALMGPIDFLSLGGFGSSNLRASNPITYRAGQAAIPAGMAVVDRGVPPPFIWPHIAAAIWNDPYTQRAYNDHVKPNALHVERDIVRELAPPDNALGKAIRDFVP